MTKMSFTIGAAHIGQPNMKPEPSGIYPTCSSFSQGLEYIHPIMEKREEFHLQCEEHSEEHFKSLSLVILRLFFYLSIHQQQKNHPWMRNTDPTSSTGDLVEGSTEPSL